ncbi:MAG: VWA domain-containing protein [Bryobacteraceae bacterium]|nr:VWA domain-containing protein [Solibacteraceae bacterium]MCO5353611.1 VWA domain-containing protein [Bryobacteraceae bacterium]
MPQSKRIPGSRRRERGIAIMLTAVMLFVLVPVAGLALDAVLLYALKAKLSTAADAAAIAAARSLNVGMTLAEQENEARQRALDFFRANFPNNAYNTSNHSVNVTVAETAFRTRTVTVNAAINAPQYFMRWLGFSSTRINALGRASRRDVNLVMVLDRSGSMGNAATASSPCAVMKNAATTFTNMFAEGRDRLGFVAFGSGYHIGFSPSMNFKSGGSSSMPSRLGSMTCQGGTSTAMAAWKAYELLQAIDEPGALNLIVLFTDGWPNGITADLPYRRITDSRYGGGIRTDSTTTTTTRNINTRWQTGYPNYTTTYSMLPSPCRQGNTSSPPYHYYNMRCNNSSCSSYTSYSSPNWNPNFNPPSVRGVITQAAGDQDTLNTGATVGPIRPEDSSLTDAGTTLVSGLDDCTATTAVSNSWTGVRRDVAYLPDTDAYGNSTRGFMDFPGVMQFSSGPYVGKIRIDVPRSLTRGALNAADSAASRIRSDVSLNPVIYVIGLGDVNHEINRRMANDPTSPIFDDARPTGLYVYAPTPTELNYAFVRVASEILRLAQ